MTRAEFEDKMLAELVPADCALAAQGIEPLGWHENVNDWNGQAAYALGRIIGVMKQL